MKMFNTREIDRIAQDIFRANIPPAWIISEMHPDFSHIDFFVEIAHGMVPSGIMFGVQLKGTASPKYSQNNINFSMETPHIIYYEKVKQPIIIIVIDVKNRKGYYIFSQEWSKSLNKSNWKMQKEITIKIPIQNAIEKKDSFLQAILRADKFMRELWPSSIPAAIDYEKKRLENIDPRFKIIISHDDGKTNYNLQAKEPVYFTFHFKNPEQVMKKFIDFSDRGLPISFDTKDILKVEGSDLLKEAFDKTLPGKFTIELKYESTMILSTLDNANQETSLLYEVKGIMSGGTKEIRFEGGINETPFRMTMALHLANWIITKSPHFEIKFNEYTDWEGRPILLLPFFAKILSFFNAIKDGNRIKISCEIKGIRILEGKSGPAHYESMNYIFEYLNLIQKARVISSSLNTILILPSIDSISSDDIESIELIYDLIDKGEHRQDGSNTKIKATITPNDQFYELFGKEETDKEWPYSFIIEIQEPRYSIFGKEIYLGPLRFTLTNPKIIVHKTDTDSRNIQLIGTKNSEFIRSKQ